VSCHFYYGHVINFEIYPFKVEVDNLVTINLYYKYMIQETFYI